MDLVTHLLRKFSYVRGLERRLRKQDQSLLDVNTERSRLETDGARLRAEKAEWERFCPLGHFYSPLPSRAEVEAAFARGGCAPPIEAVDLCEEGQFALLKSLAVYYGDMPFPETPTAGWRFHLSNPSYGPYDAFLLYAVMRHLQPRRLVEVGCGYSSAAILDINDRVLGGRMQLAFIDPDLAQHRRLLLPGEVSSATLIEQPVQEVPIGVVESLEANDILFMDTSHVSKVGSDVNHLFFKVLPALKPGVWVHIHDVTGNLEYPRHWFDEGRAWNELYLLRAFLMYNRAFKVMLSSALMYNHHRDFLREHMPMCAAGGGGQIWLRREACGLS